MKVSELRRILAALASGLSEVGARSYADSLEEFARELGPFNKRDVAEICRSPLGASDIVSGTTLAAPLRALDAFGDFLSVTTKPKTKAALNELKIFMNDRQDMTIRSFIDSLQVAFSPGRPLPANDASLVDAYVDALKEAKHDDKQFPKLFEALSTDERLNKDDIVEVASRFAFKMAKSTSKKLALERIWKVHSASETSAAKSRATKGKSAA